MVAELDYRVERRFTRPVREHHVLCRMEPCGDWIPAAGTPFEWRLTPGTICDARSDCWGQRLQYAFIPEGHTELILEIHGRFARAGEFAVQPGPEWCGGYSVLTAPGATLIDWAARSPAGSTAAIAAYNAAMFVHDMMEYRPGVTGPSTSAEEAARLGAGVCQDLVQATLSIARMHGARVRYVAGFLPGEGESHAWLEVWDGDRWIGIDPTHGDYAAEEAIAWARGRDASDCRLDRGVFTGSAMQSMTVSARVSVG
jgi:Transglutaminase-like superfamily